MPALCSTRVLLTQCPGHAEVGMLMSFAVIGTGVHTHNGLFPGCIDPSEIALIYPE